MSAADSASGSIVVQKYGGSSVADVAGIHRVAERVVQTARAGHRVVVVVSAMGNTTNELLALARSVSPNPRRRELDLLVSVGERVSMTLLAMAIIDRGVPAASFTGSQSGIITDEQHVAARVLEVRPQRVRAALDAGQVAIVAGFQGVSRTREVTTLGRGGSDTTAVVLAAALGAEWCELCSDVDGVWSADPRVVGDARKLEVLPLDAAAALSGAGAKVLQADAIAHARRLGVQLHAAATSRASGSGTALPPGPAPDAPIAVTADPQLEWFAVDGSLGTDAVAGTPFGGAVRAWVPGDSGGRVVVDLRNLHDRSALTLPDGVRSLGRVAQISAVGRALVSDPAETARCIAALGPFGLRAWWAVGETWSGLVDVEQADAAQRALHTALVR